MIGASSLTASSGLRRRFVAVPASSPGRRNRPIAAATCGVFSLALFALCCLYPRLQAAESSEPAPLAAHALLLDVVNTGEKIVAVGDHGNVVISRDNGVSWTQILVPTRALLTAVAFPDAQHGWIVGHDGVILNTTDGGLTWERQDDGKNIETVLLDVNFLDTKRGFAAGAYGKFITTEDGGKTWTPLSPVDGEMHFNGIASSSDHYLYIAGEGGTLLISPDTGKKWRHANVPYDGSLFGALALEKGIVFAYGLRGHLLRSDDHGKNWTTVNVSLKGLLMCALHLKNGVVLIGGEGGFFLISRDGGRIFESWKPANLSTSVAGLVEVADGAIITVGEAGAVRLQLP